MENNQYKLKDQVFIKKESIFWHKENNAYGHLESMNTCIGKKGIIIDCYVNTRKGLRGYRINTDGGGSWSYSINCIEPINEDRRTKLSKFINDIYMREKEEMKNDGF